jgi:hypothetical protein
MSDVQQQGGGIATAEPEILEIRVHGVHNTPPAEMLETTPENITRDRGDDLGSFWRRKDDTAAHGIERTEAFWWGAQARTGGGALAAIGRVFVHIGWFLLLPFALSNLAYWTREIKPQKEASEKYWDGDSGAATVRIFSLLLTLLAVVAFCSVAIDLVAVQCFRRPAEEGQSGQVCAALPAALDGFRDLGRDSRAALFGLLPIAIILLLYVIGRRGRVNFEERVRRFAADLKDYKNEPGVPLLATGGFWSQSRIGRTSEWLHVAGAVTTVIFLLALDAAYMNDKTECWRRDIAEGEDPVDRARDCLAVAWEKPIPFWFGAGALVLLILIVLLVWRASHTKDHAKTEAKRGLAMACLAVSIAGYGVWTLLTFTPAMPPPVDDPPFLGLIVAPLFLMTAALLLALAGVGWKSRPVPEDRRLSPDFWRRPVSAVLLIAVGVLLLGSHLVEVEVARWLLLIAAVGVAIHLLIAWSVPVKHEHQAWRGQGAAVAMLLGLFASMALSSLLVLGTAFWLNTPADAGSVTDIWRTPANAPPHPLDVPNAYERFAVLLTAITLVMVILVLVAMAWNLILLVSFTLPKLRRPADDESDFDQLAGVENPGVNKYPARLADTDVRRRRRVTVRRSSHLMHRGEPLFGWLAVLAAVGFLSLSSALVFDTVRDLVEQISPVLPDAIRIASNAVLAFVALIVVGAVAAHAAASSERPLGVFWDVVAFFPRAGHPFAPPCYGERVVPELAARTRAWLELDTGSWPRAVLFTAHSMGSTICAATILALRGERIKRGDEDKGLVTDHVAMLSYGTQLRAYFSRFFPAVFGNRTLGVPGTVGPSLWRRDPWAEQVDAEWKRPLPPPPADREKTLTGLLGSNGERVPRWRSLWRRTDYLGFPVYAYRGAGNPIDLGATESAPASYLWRIATHSDYLGTPQFSEARDELVEGLGGRPT